MAKPSVFPIKPQDVDKIWGALQGFIGAAIEEGIPTHNLNDVLESVKKSGMVLWAIMSDKGKLCGAGVTALENHPRMNIATLLWLGGYDIDLWEETALKVLASWARLNKCAIIRNYGRKGWVRRLQSHGWIEAGTLVLLDLHTDNAKRADSCQAAAVKPVLPVLHLTDLSTTSF